MKPAASMTLGALLAGFAETPAVLADLPVSGLAADSSAVRPGDLFFALRGGRRHGLEFLDAVRAAGAQAVLWEPPYAGSLPGTDAASPLLAVPELPPPPLNNPPNIDQNPPPPPPLPPLPMLLNIWSSWLSIHRDRILSMNAAK